MTKEWDRECPRCGSKTVQLATYHFGYMYQAECAGCGFGTVYGDTEDMALSRLRGKYLKS